MISWELLWNLSTSNWTAIWIRRKTTVRTSFVKSVKCHFSLVIFVIIATDCHNQVDLKPTKFARYSKMKKVPGPAMVELLRERGRRLVLGGIVATSVGIAGFNYLIHANLLESYKEIMQLYTWVSPSSLSRRKFEIDWFARKTDLAFLARCPSMWRNDSTRLLKCWSCPTRTDRKWNRWWSADSMLEELVSLNVTEKVMRTTLNWFFPLKRLT